MDIAVLIVDDFPLIRRGIAAALELDPAITVVGEAETVREGPGARAYASPRCRAVGPETRRR